MNFIVTRTGSAAWLSGINFHCPGLRDRRLAASDEHGSPGIRHVYRRESHAYERGALRGSRWARFDRHANDINTVILHITSGPHFVRGAHRVVNNQVLFDADRTAGRHPLPAAETDGTRRSDHRIDRVAAHFVVTRDGGIFYTHDMSYITANASGRYGIDIEFAGDNHGTGATPPTNPMQRTTVAQIRAGRRLLAYLRRRLPSLNNIHPHGQVQSANMDGTRCGQPGQPRCGKLVSCCGPDLWVNIGKWAVQSLGSSGRPFQSASPIATQYQNNGNHQEIDAYDQGVQGY
jgi:hypothetical protein